MTNRILMLEEMGYSEKAVNLILHRTNLGEMENPTVKGKAVGDCMDTMILYLDIENDIIKDAKYEFVGCAGLQATGAGLTEMVKGKTITEARQISDQQIIEFLESLPAAKYECATIAQNTLYETLNNFAK